MTYQNILIMKRAPLVIGCLLGIVLTATILFSFKSRQSNYEFQQVTTIESVIPGGLGRSRMISSNPDGKLEEKKMKNFFSLTGINFKNVKENDRKISKKIAQMHEDGWEMINVTSGVYSSGITDDLGTGGTGIFITRYLFRKPA